MASYYHEARAEKAKIKAATQENKRRAERRAELATVEVSRFRPHRRTLLRKGCSANNAWHCPGTKRMDHISLYNSQHPIKKGP